MVGAMTRRRVVLLTSLYPWGPGEEFIAPELHHWVRDDVELTILPWQSTELRRPVPEGIVVDDRLDRLRRSGWRLALAGQLFSGRFWAEAARSVRAGKADPRTLWRALVPSAAAGLTERALADLAASRGPFDVAYSYWFDHQTLGALAAARRGHVRRVVSRAHGYDLYEERSPDGRLPFRREMARRVSLLAPISSTGLQYVRHRYTAPESTSACHRLGVTIPDGCSPCPADLATVRILSISSTHPVKRLPALIETVAEIARLLPGSTISWAHAGSGDALPELAGLASERLPPNAKVDWLGQLSREELNETILGSAWNLALNTSSSEGVPISLMEAMAGGIPVAATAVGGTPELVAPPRGLLLSSDDPPARWAAEIVEALPRTCDPSWRVGFREEILSNWDETRNHQRFIRAVLATCET